MDIAKSPFVAPFNRQMALWSDAVIAQYLRSKQDEIAAFAEDRGLSFESVMDVCIEAATKGRVPLDLMDFDIPPIEEVVVKEFVRDAILNVESVEERRPMRSLSENSKVSPKADEILGDAIYDLILDEEEIDLLGLDDNPRIEAAIAAQFKRLNREGKYKTSFSFPGAFSSQSQSGIKSKSLDLAASKAGLEGDFEHPFEIAIYDNGADREYEADKNVPMNWAYSYTLENVKGKVVRKNGKYLFSVSNIGAIKLDAKASKPSTGRRTITRGDMETDVEEQTEFERAIKEIQGIMADSRHKQARIAEGHKLYAPKPIVEERIERRPLGHAGSTGSAFNKGAMTFDDMLKNMKK